MKKNNAVFFVLMILFIFISVKIAQAVPDSDRDGVPDANDKCPGTAVLIVDSNGCSCAQKNCPSLNNPCRKDCDDSTYEAICGKPIDYASCGSARTCPEDKCEGDLFVDYPESKNDYCLNGDCFAYSCAALSRAYNADCASGKKPNINESVNKTVTSSIINLTNLTNITNLTSAAIGGGVAENLENASGLNLSNQSATSKDSGFPFIPSGEERTAASPIKFNLDARIIIVGFISIAILIAIISAILIIARQIAVSEAVSIERDLKLRRYILAALAAGFTIDQIRRRLKMSKIPDKHVKRAMRGIRLKR
ncbi:MAG: hypothetical protein Q7J54_03995 [Candidatus Woesearchaeota archaeon]|nr:hypothetical protein [Candidatus Woesearchaeota archaeon]